MRGLIQLLPLSILLIGSCQKHSDYAISGHLTGFPDSTMLYLQDINSDEVIDSALLFGGQFAFNGHLPEEPEQLWIEASIGDKFVYANLLIGNETIEVTGDIKDFPRHVRVSGSTTQDEADQLRDLTRTFDDRRDSLVHLIEALPPDSQQTAGKVLWGKTNAIDDTVRKLQLVYIKAHVNTYAALTTLMDLKEDLPKDSVAALYGELSDELRKSKYGRTIGVYVHSKVPEIGDRYVDFRAQDQDGDTIAFSSLTGDKYVLLDFSAAYCGPCIRSGKELRAFNRMYGDSLRIVTFSTDRRKDLWQVALKRDSIIWPSLWDGQGRYSGTYIKYGISGVPTFYFIGPAGKVLDKWVGYGEGVLAERLKKFGFGQGV